MTTGSSNNQVSARPVDRCINRLKHWRGIATRYEKTATIYLARLHIAGISSGPPQ
jgi:transposase